MKKDVVPAVLHACVGVPTRLMARKVQENKAMYNRKVAGLILLGLALIPLVGAAILQGGRTVGLRIILISCGIVLVVLGVFFTYSVTSPDG